MLEFKLYISIIHFLLNFQICKLIEKVDYVLKQFRLPIFYEVRILPEMRGIRREVGYHPCANASTILPFICFAPKDPRPHMTIGWTLGNVLPAIGEQKRAGHLPLLQSPAGHPLLVDRVQCKVASSLYTFKLKQ